VIDRPISLGEERKKEKKERKENSIIVYIIYNEAVYIR